MKKYLFLSLATLATIISSCSGSDNKLNFDVQQEATQLNKSLEAAIDTAQVTTREDYDALKASTRWRPSSMRPTSTRPTLLPTSKPLSPTRCAPSLIRSIAPRLTRRSMPSKKFSNKNNPNLKRQRRSNYLPATCSN